jgi:heme-degrading monooxygenase HmoA
MYVVRDVFHCKPGQSKAVAEKLSSALSMMKKMPGYKSGRVLVDYVASYWTVVLETEVDTLEQFERAMNEYASSNEMREAMKGYMDMVHDGHREIFRIV